VAVSCEYDNETSGKVCMVYLTADEPLAFQGGFYSKEFFLHGEGPRSRSYGRTTALRLFVQPYDEDKDKQFFYQVLQVMEHQWNEIDRGKPTTRRKTCPQCHFVHHKPRVD
jgi:hypothetical protein